MKETRIPNLNIDPVGIRLERIIAEKKAANEEALGKIKSLAEIWGELNKTIESDIKDEFELMDLEDQALAEALGDLEENRTKPVKDSFIISGKALTEKEGISLPNVTVTLSQRVGRKLKLLAQAVTDNLGNFIIRLDKVAENENAKMEVEYQVYSGDGTLLHNEVQSIAQRPGGIARVSLAIAETDLVSNQLEAGKAVRDSIKGSRELITSRMENMRGAHDALAKMTEIAREDLGSLYEAMAVEPPEIKSVIARKQPEDGQPEPDPDIKEEPKQPTDEKPKKPRGDDTGPKRPVPQIPKLESLKGIGRRRVEILKKANIKDIKTFVKTDNKKLKNLLGELDFTDMKKDARTLLKKK